MEINELKANLSLFSGSEHYYGIAPKFLVTDGTKYLADSAKCFWLLDAVVSHLLEIGTADGFVLIRLVVENSSALLKLEDGNGRVHCKQTIPYTDFPAPQQVLYACWD